MLRGCKIFFWKERTGAESPVRRRCIFYPVPMESMEIDQLKVFPNSTSLLELNCHPTPDSPTALLLTHFIKFIVNLSNFNSYFLSSLVR